jgi:lysylphosphatidylglycerol synthetase-like protein (DUF2156 family)
MDVRAPDFLGEEISARQFGGQERLRALRQYGNFALAYSATFQAGLEHFGNQEGFIAYKPVGGTDFVLSDPVAPADHWEDLIRSFLRQSSNVCFWQTSRSVAEILQRSGFSVNEMGTESWIDLANYGFGGPTKRNFRRALTRAADCGYVIEERMVASLDREELKEVSHRWRSTRGIKNREMTFLTRPAILDDEVDVRKFFTFNPEGRLQAFAFFDPIYDGGAIVGYLCSAKRRLPEADKLVGYAILHRAIRAFQDEGKSVLSLGLSPLCGIEDKDLANNRLLSFAFRLSFRSALFNRFIYPLRGFAAHKQSFCGSAKQTFCAFKRRLSLSQLIKMPRACNVA